MNYFIALSLAFAVSCVSQNKNSGSGDPPRTESREPRPFPSSSDKTKAPSVDIPPGTPLNPVGPVYDGMATHFEALGTPTGGCGVPTEELDSPDFVALNVQHTPGDYESSFPRPIVGKPPQTIGAWDNGRNCGRWVMVTIGDRCQGINDGQPNKPFCRDAPGTPWVSDAFNGAKLPMIIADSCQDGNAWCRDDRFHLDLATESLIRFKKDGKAAGPLLPDHWGNRKVSWQYIKAPLYTGDIKLGFVKNASPYWVSLMITHLENGIHGVEAKVGDAWKKATMVGDNGQVYTLPNDAQSPFSIRVLDAEDKLVGGGRVYTFKFPDTCAPKCNSVYTPITYELSQ